MKKYLNFKKFSFSIANFLPHSKLFTNHCTNSKNFHSNSKYPFVNFTSSFRKKLFCNITRLNIDKLSLDKIENSNPDKLIAKNTPETEKPFNKDEYITEFGPATKWEDEVIKSELQVVVDCYAE
jgi:hypothetical protein